MTENKLWEDTCVHVVQVLVQKMPSIVDKGFNQWGITIPAYNGIELPDITDYDTGQSLIGYCGLGSTDCGDLFLTLDNNKLSGLDTVALQPGQQPLFTAPDTDMLVPLTFSSLTLNGSFTFMQHCQASGSNTPTPTSVTGAYTATITGVDIDLAISGLDLNQGSAGSVTLTWTNEAFALQNPPVDPCSPPASTPSADNVTFTITYDSGAACGDAPHLLTWQQKSVCNYQKAGLGQIEAKLTCAVIGLLSGSTPVQGHTLPGDILQYINQAFNNV
jgi:hypothetical protein